MYDVNDIGYTLILLHAPWDIFPYHPLLVLCTVQYCTVRSVHLSLAGGMYKYLYSEKMPIMLRAFCRRLWIL